MLATTADRPQLTLAHIATFQPERGGEIKGMEGEMGRIMKMMRVEKLLESRKTLQVENGGGVGYRRAGKKDLK